MCGIVGLFLKDKSLEPKLGSMLTDMLITMTDRGPDSAGIAIYGRDEDNANTKLTIQSGDPAQDFEGLDEILSNAVTRQGLHADQGHPCCSGSVRRTCR